MGSELPDKLREHCECRKIEGGCDFCMAANALDAFPQYIENARRSALREAAAICDDYADAQFALPYSAADACGLASQVLASKLRTLADFTGAKDK